MDCNFHILQVWCQSPFQGALVTFCDKALVCSYNINMQNKKNLIKCLGQRKELYPHPRQKKNYITSTLKTEPQCHIECDWNVKPLSHQTAMPQGLYSVLKTCQRTVGSPQNISKNIKFTSYSVNTTSSQHPYSVHMTFPQHLYSVHDASNGTRSCCSVFTAHSQRSHCDHGV